MAQPPQMDSEQGKLPGSRYVHGTDREEQGRLANFNEVTNQAFVEFLDLTQARAVLEVGSGLGILTNMVGARLVDGAITGVEQSVEQLGSARALRPNVTFEQGDAHRLRFFENSFDVVYCRWVLEHVADPVCVLSEMKRVLRPGGKLYVVENDVTLNRLHPTMPAFEQVWSVDIPALQARLGGDARIGSRLYALLMEAGFRGIELSVQPEVHWFGSEGFRPWVQNLAGIIRGATGGLIEMGVPEARIKAAQGELELFLEKQNASAVFHFGRATGAK